MKVAVTGSHGYIGSVLSKMLTEQGYYVYACDNKKVLGGNFKHLRTVINTSFDNEFFVNMVIDNNIDTIFHLAASSLLGPSATDPLLYFQNNTARTINLLDQLARRQWKGRIVFSSTAAVYGDQGEIVTEDHPTQPCNNYGLSKLMCEEAMYVAHMYGIKTTVFRYFNVAGGYNNVGQNSEEPHIITRICNAAADRAPLVVYGNKYATRDGTCLRDYVHVRDICQAQIYAMEKQVDGTFNLGTLKGTTVSEIIEAFVNQNLIHVPYTIGEEREGDPAYLVANPQKYVDTGFKYRYSDIDLIVKSAWEYFNGL